MKICAIIVSCNHQDIISDLVLRCRNALEPDVLLLDNHSTDDTVAKGRRAGAMILDISEIEGTTLINRGLRAAQGFDYTHAILVWADRPDICVPEEIPRLVNHAWDRPDGIIVGIHEEGRGNLWTSVSAFRPLGPKSTGFRLYPIEETLALSCREEGAGFEAESMVRASWAGIPTAAVPINLRPSSPEVSTFGRLERKLFLGMLVRLPRLLKQRFDEF